MAQNGRPPFKVTRPMRQKVEELVACGESRDAISRAIGCSVPTLDLHFGAELLTGRSKRRAEVVAMLFKTARKGNVSAQKKLEEMTSLAGAAEEFEQKASEPRATKAGKKELASQAAETAGAGTDWGSDLHVPDVPLN